MISRCRLEPNGAVGPFIVSLADTGAILWANWFDNDSTVAFEGFSLPDGSVGQFALTTPAWLSPELCQQPVVVGVAANPEPENAVRQFDAQGTIVQPDADRPEPPDFLEVQGGMIAIRLEEG